MILFPSPPSNQPRLPTSLRFRDVGRDLMQSVELSQNEAQNAGLGNVGSSRAQSPGQNLETPCPNHVTKGQTIGLLWKNSLVMSFLGILEKVSLCIIYLHIQLKE